MRSPRLFPPILFAALFLPLFGTAGAAETATLPYAKVEEIWQKTDSIDRKKLVVLLQFVSKNKSVKPSDIAMTIKSRTGEIPLRLGPEGDLLNFPRTEVLKKENPLIETNQPKGTLALKLEMRLVVPSALTFRYARLSEGLAEVNRLIKAQAGMLSLVAPTMNSAVFVFPETSGGKASLEILAPTGPKPAVSDARGELKLTLDPKLIAANPEIRLSERPLRVLIDQ